MTFTPGTADSNIAALKSGHDELATIVRGLSDADLTGPSGCADWDISQVLSHLGSGAEINLATVQAALEGKPNPSQSFNTSVWDRWNAMTPRERADGFLVSNAKLLELYDSLDAETRSTLKISMNFLPDPIDVGVTAGLRLSEFAFHSWDVRIAYDKAATLAPEAVESLFGTIGYMLHWIAKPEALAGQTAVLRIDTTDPASTLTLRLGEEIKIEDGAATDTDGTLTIPAEALLRLLTGRLAPSHTPSSVTIDGPVDLDTVRRAFPGF
jgi:uncharacterized protein (TIGR03083 family)